MANSVDDPLKTHYRISGTGLDDYRDSHSPKAANGLYPRKVAQDFYMEARGVQSPYQDFSDTALGLEN